MAEIKNLRKAAERIQKAIKKKERIIVYGDSDLDGVSSVLILEEAIKSLGGNVVKAYFPNRENDGYGITTKAIEELKVFAPALFITVDLGISNVGEVDAANKEKFEVIIIDHHEALDSLPKASIIVDPKQPSDTYPFKGLAACGVTLRVAEKLLGKHLSSLLRKSLVELAAIGTIADMMPREDENIFLIEEGLRELENSWRPGIQALFSSNEYQNMPNVETKISQMISMLNVRDVADGFPASFRFFTCFSVQEVLPFIEFLMQKNKIRKQQISNAVDEVRERARNAADSPCIFEGDTNFEYLVLGSVASIISNEFRKPAFIYTQKETECLGSVRAPSGYDTVEAMKHCKDLLITYGGHAKASGFRLRSENLAKFKARLEEYFSGL